MVVEIFITLVVLLAYGWFVFKIAAMFSARLKQFGLRDLLLAFAFAAVFIFLAMQVFGPISAILLSVIALAAVFFAAFRPNPIE